MCPCPRPGLLSPPTHPAPSSFLHNPFSNMMQHLFFLAVGTARCLCHAESLCPLPQGSRPRTWGQPSGAPTKPAWSLREKDGRSASGLGQACTAQSGRLPFPPLHVPTHHHFRLLPAEAAQPVLGPNPRPSFQCSHGQLPLHTAQLSHTHTLTHKM